MTLSSRGPVLVTGAAGFAGGHLLDAIEAEVPSLVAWRRPGEALPPAPTGRACRWFEVDVLDRAAVRDAVLAIRPVVVYHLAGAAHTGRSWEHTRSTFEVNVVGTHHLLSALAALNEPCRVLIPGSALVYRPQAGAIEEEAPVGPDSPYGLSKLAQEMAGERAAAGRLEVLLPRAFNHIGPRQDPSFFAASFARQVARIECGLSEPVLRVGNLEARRDLTDVRDTVRAYRALVESGRSGRIYNVCSGIAYRIQDVLDGLLARSTSRVEVRVDEALYRPHDAAMVVGSRTRIAAETGWAPAIPLDRTLTDLLSYWRGAVRAS